MKRPKPTENESCQQHGQSREFFNYNIPQKDTQNNQNTTQKSPHGNNKM